MPQALVMPSRTRSVRSSALLQTHDLFCVVRMPHSCDADYVCRTDSTSASRASSCSVPTACKSAVRSAMPPRGVKCCDPRPCPTANHLPAVTEPGATPTMVRLSVRARRTPATPEARPLLQAGQRHRTAAPADPAATHPPTVKLTGSAGTHPGFSCRRFSSRRSFN